MQNLTFKTKQEFVQVAFDTVAKIISDHAQPCLEALVPAISAEKCLVHLASVAHDWSYDASVIGQLFGNSVKQLRHGQNPQHQSH